MIRSKPYRRWLVVVLVTAIGCAEFNVRDYFDLNKNIPWGEGADGERKPPMKVAAIWTDTILNQAGRPSLRGFGGRLMFYAAEGGKPIKVKGSLTVYAFDDSRRDPSKVRPDRKYVFSAEQFEKHYSKSALGHSYSVWLPWDEAGGPKREIGLLVRFTPEQGATVIGDESKQVLPGHSESDPTQYAEPVAATNAAMRTDGAVRPVSYQQPQPTGGVETSAAPAAAPRRMTTTTITLPNSSGLRAPAQAAAPAPGDGAALAPSAWQATQDRVIGAPATASWNRSASAASATPTAATEAAPPSTHFGPQRRRPLGEPLSRLDRDRAPWQPSR